MRLTAAQNVLLLISLVCVAPAWAKTNITVDDQYGDQLTGQLPTYNPTSSWGQGANCSVCTAQLNASDTFDGSWHDSTHVAGSPNSMMTILFNGTAVYAFCVLPNFKFMTYPTNVTFFMDNAQVGKFAYTPNKTTDYIYHYPVYTNATLSNSRHNFTMATAGEGQSLVLFDYLVYTTPENVTITSTPIPGGSPTSSSAAPSSTSTAAKSSAGSVTEGFWANMFKVGLACAVLRAIV